MSIYPLSTDGIGRSVATIYKLWKKHGKPEFPTFPWSTALMSQFDDYFRVNTKKNMEERLLSIDTKRQ